MANVRKLVSPKGSQLCEVGLVDEKGVFLYLMDADETKHFRFSNETQLINSLRDRCAELDEKLGELTERFEALDHICESMYWLLDSKQRYRNDIRLEKVGIFYGNKKK